MTAPSKSQLKREAQETFQLGRRLVELPDAQLKALPLDSDVLEAVYFARSIRSHGARKRQLGFLAGLLRRADLEPLEAALHSLDNEPRANPTPVIIVAKPGVTACWSRATRRWAACWSNAATPMRKPCAH